MAGCRGRLGPLFVGRRPTWACAPVMEGRRKRAGDRGRALREEEDDLASGPGLAVRATGHAVCGGGAPTSGAQLAGAGRWLGCWATRDGCCERADDARVGPRERVGLLCARRAGAECGAGLRRWAGAEKGLGPSGIRMGWAVGVLGPGLVSLLGLDSFSNFFSYF